MNFLNLYKKGKIVSATNYSGKVTISGSLLFMILVVLLLGSVYFVIDSFLIRSGDQFDSDLIAHISLLTAAVLFTGFSITLAILMTRYQVKFYGSGGGKQFRPGPQKTPSGLRQSKTEATETPIRIQ